MLSYFSKVKGLTSTCLEETGLIQRVNQINIGELQDVRDIICNEMEEENEINRTYWDLLQLLL